MQNYAVVIHEDPDGGFWGEVPALPGCYSQGETVEEALANIKEATLLCLEDEKISSVENEDVSLHLITV